MKREIIVTSDGSTTIHLPEWNEQYHSKHGAIQESYHVFIKNGLDQFKTVSKLNILEIGYGTGLNCFITYLEAQKSNLIVNYVGVEAYPIEEKEIEKLNYIKLLNSENVEAIYKKMHSIPWNKSHKISRFFNLEKRKQFFKDIDDKDKFNLIYFDAFGARIQPELWTVEIFKKMFEATEDSCEWRKYWSACGRVVARVKENKTCLAWREQNVAIHILVDADIYDLDMAYWLTKLVLGQYFQSY